MIDREAFIAICSTIEEVLESEGVSAEAADRLKAVPGLALALQERAEEAEGALVDFSANSGVMGVRLVPRDDAEFPSVDVIATDGLEGARAIAAGVAAAASLAYGSAIGHLGDRLDALTAAVVCVATAVATDDLDEELLLALQSVAEKGRPEPILALDRLYEPGPGVEAADVAA